MVILTDKRREVLEGTYEGTESTRQSHRSNIRTRSKEALHELIEVAESDEVANHEVFTPEVIERLLRAIMGPRETIRPRWDYEDASMVKQLRDDPHRTLLYNAIDGVRGYYLPYYEFSEEPEPNVYTDIGGNE
jgi:hypothetical protein